MVNEKKEFEDNSFESRNVPPDDYYSNSLSPFNLKKKELLLSSLSDADQSTFVNGQIKMPIENMPFENGNTDSFDGNDDISKISTQLLSINNHNENANGFTSDSSNLESDLECTTNSTTIDSCKHFNFDFETTVPEFDSSGVNGSNHIALNLPLQLNDIDSNEFETPNTLTDIAEANENAEFIQTVEIQLQDIKSDYSEFDAFVLLFFYINNVYDPESKFDQNSLEFTFKTNDSNFYRAHDSDVTVNYHLKLNFKNEILPENSYCKIKKKSIEIRLFKAKKLTWGTIKEMCATSIPTSLPSYDLVPTENYSHNTWTPCFPNLPESNGLQLVQCQSPTSDQKFDLGNKGKFYGYTGLENLMNTCFMNAVLQCLSNTDPLKNYFLSNEYVHDINESNPLGHRGIIVKAFAQFLNQLWMGKQSSFAPTRIKNLVGEKITSIFMGFNQHDAQEFMSFFLDAIHEDLNKNQNRPKSDANKKSQNNDDADNEDLFDETDEKNVEVYKRLQAKANDMWNQYLLYNNSIIIDLFCGQFKSILTCPDCTKKSIMFDPFLYVSLPIPPPKITYQVIFFSRENLTGMCKSAYRFVVKLSRSATVNQLLNLVSQKTDVSNKNMRLIQQHANMPPKILNPNWLLSDYHSSSNDMPSSNRPLLLFESLKDQYEDYIELCIVQRCLKPISKYFGSDNCEEQITPVGYPFIVYLNKSMLSYSYLSSVLCSFARYSVAATRLPCNETVTNAKLSTLKTELHHEFNLNQYNFSASTNSQPFSDCSNLGTINGNIPHFIYYKACPVNNNDVIAPFILCKSFDFGNFEKCEEIVPPVLNEKDELEELIIEEKESEEDKETLDEEEETNTLQTLDANSLLNSSDIDGEYLVEDSSRAVDSVVKEYDNDSVIDLGNTVFYLTMDWINSRSYESYISVKLSTANCSEINNVDCSDVNNDSDITLDECLKSFNEPEVLGPQNCWRCPSCKVLREATKQLSFWRLPPILVIQLKRFKMRDVIYRDKIFQLVKYPINGLDLSKYISNIDLVNGDDGQSESNKPIYDLYAVVNHIGNAFGGHYTAFAKSFDDKLGWRYFNDCLVENVNESCLVTADAYLLFYKCRTSG